MKVENGNKRTKDKNKSLMRFIKHSDCKIIIITLLTADKINGLKEM